MEEKDLTGQIPEGENMLSEAAEAAPFSPETFVANTDAHDEGHAHSSHSHHSHHSHHSSRHRSKRSKSGRRKAPRTAVQAKVERYTLIGTLVVLLFAFILLTVWCVGANGELDALFQKVERLTERVEELENRVENMPTGSATAPTQAQEDPETLPDYALQEADTLLAQVRPLQNANTVTFLAISDMHLNQNDPRSETALRHAGQAMAYIRKELNIDFAVSLGDLTYGAADTTISVGSQEIAKVNGFLEEAFADIPNFRLVGNHDTLLYSHSQNKDYLDSYELYDLVGKYNEGAVFQAGEADRGYCYRDLEAQKLRIIVLNTSDIKGISGFSAEDISSERFNTVSAAQLTFLAEALDLSDKADAGSWKVLLLSHIPLNAASNANVAALLDAYTRGASGTITLGMQQVSYDFAESNQAKVIANIHGHYHNYRVSSLGAARIPAIGIPNASIDRSRSNAYPDGFGEEVIYEKAPGTADETAFCVVTIDLSTGVIYTSAYGAGYNRQTQY